MNKRVFIKLGLTIISAPAIVKASSLMKYSGIALPQVPGQIAICADWGNDNNGGFIVPVELHEQIIKKITEISPFRRLWG